MKPFSVPGTKLICSLALLGMLIGCSSASSDAGKNAQTKESPASAQTAKAEKPKKQRIKTESTFDADRAWKDLSYQVNIGPRYVGSPGYVLTRDWIKKSLKDMGYKVFDQKFKCSTPEGEKEFTNIIACLDKDVSQYKEPEPVKDEYGYYADAGSEELKPRTSILLSAHYDTKRFPKFSFVGANDGASGVAALLELARIFKDKPIDKHRLVFCFFDGEEAIKDWTYDDSLYGSTYFADSLGNEKCPVKLNAEDIVAALVLDMVADKDLHITYDSISHPHLMEMLFTLAREVGFTDEFRRDCVGQVLDDHEPLLRRQIPAIDIIGFRLTSTGTYPSYWHTTHDTIDKVSADSLHVVGSVVDLFVRDLDVILD